MRYVLIALLPFVISMISHAQSMNTTITIVDGVVTRIEQTPRPVPDVFMSFEEADKDGDGRISRQEARDAGIVEFNRADRSRTGYLTRQEYEAASQF